MEKHWFTLHADTFLWLKEETGIVYNSQNKRKFVFHLSNRIENKCQQLLQTDNLYTTELTVEELDNKEIIQWIHSIIEIGAGKLSHNLAFDQRPVSMKPILKVQDNKDYYELQHAQGLGGEILRNLHELSFYLNDSKYGNNEYYKQHIFPLIDCQTLDSLKIQSFIGNSINPFLCNISLVGNVFSYPDFKKLLNYISDLSIQSTIHVMIQDFLDNIQTIKEEKWSDFVQFNILVTTAFDCSLFNDFSFPCSITAFVFSEEDYERYLNLLKSFPLGQNTRIIPLYIKENLSFFESNVFIGEYEMENVELHKKDIFIRQTVNIGDFGKLIVMPDGYVYDNVNTPPIGTINDSPYSLVYKEFVENKSWFRIREQYPCNKCVYQWLCPSPSNYELVIEKPNLCHIKQQ